MSDKSSRILAEALDLPPMERALLVEEILASFDFPDRRDVDAAWAAETEDRIDAYERGDLSASSVQEVFDRLNREPRK
ncbi:MAG: addiction module protein [Acidobacteria bacterium]|nr:addiction module protein [Acidobacteriota bacterium]